ncbi:hypothetical protein ACP4OV_014132 [Aristida adscensionis]
MAPSRETIMHMVLGDGDTSYARNSSLQAGEQGNVKPMIEEAVASLVDGGAADRFPGGMMIADLGCSSGPNTLVLASTAVDAVRRRCAQLRQPPPELCVHFNDLPGNDFNSVIKSWADYKETLDDQGLGPVLTSVVPGSFHGRLFKKRSLHLVCSTASLHWLSQAPEDLVNRIPFFDGDEAARRAQRPAVLQGYARQFDKDFTRLLGLRAQEMVPGGRMVISMMGQRSEGSMDTILLLEFMQEVLLEMASMGLLDREKLDTFYIPNYGPSSSELRRIIDAEGSFSINQIAVHEPTIGVGSGGGGATPKVVAGLMRAAAEPMILQHFGASETAMDEFVSIAERLMKRRPLDECPNKLIPYIAASLTRRA